MTKHTWRTILRSGNLGCGGVISSCPVTGDGFVCFITGLSHRFVKPVSTHDEFSVNYFLAERYLRERGFAGLVQDLISLLPLLSCKRHAFQFYHNRIWPFRVIVYALCPDYRYCQALFSLRDG